MAVGDEDACLVFVRRHQRAVYGIASRIMSDKALAEDVAQRAFTRAWENASGFDARRGSVGAWLLVITRNLAIDELRRRRSEPLAPEVIAGLTDAATTPEPSDHVVMRADLERVSLALDALPEPQRRAVLLASWYGYTAQQVAEIETIPLGTAKTRIRTAMQRLRKGLVDAR